MMAGQGVESAGQGSSGAVKTNLGQGWPRQGWPSSSQNRSGFCRRRRSAPFVYGIQYTITDPFGNAYPETRAPGDLRILVEVTDEKRGYLSGALAALGVGILAAIFSFGAGLSAGQALAAGLGKKAQDPPAPDSRYRDRVDPGSD